MIKKLIILNLFDKNGIKKRSLQYKNKFKNKCFGQLLSDYILDIETVIIRSELIKKHNIKFTNSFNYVGDMDFFLRLSLFSRILCVNKPLSKWRIHDSNLTFLGPREFNREGNIMISNLQSDYREISSIYSKEVRKYKERIIIKDLFYLWIAGESKYVRSIITIKNYKLFLLYIISFFKFKQIKSFVRLFVEVV